MPGFNIPGAGGGGFSASGPSNTVEVRRKHRWVFEVLGRGDGFGLFNQSELLVLQSASRPSFKFEEAEMHHNQEIARFAGKQDWDPVTMMWYDVQQDPDISRGIYHWLETVVNMHTIKVNTPFNYKRYAILRVLDGTGQKGEKWTMYGTWPAAVNWQELDYTSTDLLTCECTMRYDRAIRECDKAEEPVVIKPSCQQLSS